MSGTVPPPPPPGPGPQEPGGAASPAAGPRGDDARPASPPSFAPRGASTGGPAPSPDEQPTQPHAPVPPAPSSPATSSPAPAPVPAAAPAPARSAAWNATAPVAGAPAPAAQQYGYTPQQYAYQQPPAAGPAAAGGTPPTGTTQQPSVGGRGRRLSAGWIAFIVLDVVLVVVVAVLAFRALGGPDPSSTPTGDPEAVAGQDAQEGQGDGDDAGEQEAEDGPGELVTEFASPSRNITCQVYPDQVTCGLAELNQQPAPVEGCDGTTGYVVTLSGEGEVALPCVPQGEKPGPAGDGLDELPYGESRTEGDFTCTSETDGMYCQHDPTGNGFSLARAGVGTY
ncbi:hypothetical protein [Isoptericola sp. AK164]|uniref:hypothetical protein n=1 Tax=Isoptericola sp. AK164 TaxID=3024246 RepID=UPI0024184F99|nr:hypothetical protein [Isoptericola sp. AK164]